MSLEATLEATSASSVGVSELAGYLGSFKKQYALPPWLLNAKYECHICPYNIKVGEGQILHSRDAAPRTTKLLCSVFMYFVEFHNRNWLEYQRHLAG